MSNFVGNVSDKSSIDFTSNAFPVGNVAGQVIDGGPAQKITFYMRGTDSAAGGPPAVYRYWQVNGVPDTTASLYTGFKSGALTDIVWTTEAQTTNFSTLILFPD